MKNRTDYFFGVMINIKNLDPNKINIYGKSCNNIYIYYNGIVTVKDLIYVTINCANMLYVLIDKISLYIEGSNGNKYLTLVPTDRK